MLGSTVEDAIRLSAGKAQHDQGISVSAFLASLIVASVCLGAGVLLFVMLKERYSEIL